MNPRVKEAFKAVLRLPEPEQETMAAIILFEIEDEARWQESFANSQDLPERLAAEATAEYRAGLTEPLDPDNM